MKFETDYTPSIFDERKCYFCGTGFAEDEMQKSYEHPKKYVKDIPEKIKKEAYTQEISVLRQNHSKFLVKEV